MKNKYLEMCIDIVKAHTQTDQTEVPSRRMFTCDNPQCGDIPKMFDYCGSDGPPWSRKAIYQCRDCRAQVKIRLKDLIRIIT